MPSRSFCKCRGAWFPQGPPPEFLQGPRGVVPARAAAPSPLQGLPVLQKMTDREQKRPKMLPVLHFLYDREHLKQYLKRVL